MALEPEERHYSVHPSSIMMVLILSGITTLFGALVMAYLYTRADKGMLSVPVPSLFVFNTAVLAGAGICIHQFNRFYQLRLERQAIRWGFYTLFATLLFLMLQGIAWYQLLNIELKPSSSGGYGYLYAISILHFAHVAAGIPFLLRVLWPIHTAYQQGYASILFIDDHVRRKLRHTMWYWHFIDLVWISMVLLFLINRLVG